jgi:hypothetical protein
MHSLSLASGVHVAGPVSPAEVPSVPGPPSLVSAELAAVVSSDDPLVVTDVEADASVEADVTVVAVVAVVIDVAALVEPVSAAVSSPLSSLPPQASTTTTANAENRENRIFES